MSKRITAFVLALAIVLSLTIFAAPVSAAIEHEEQLYIDLGILPPKKNIGLIKPTLSREQLAEILVKMEGMEGLASKEDLAADISRSNRKNEINYCIEKNYLRVNEDGAFRPSGSITYPDAIRAMVTLLGYDVLVSNKDDDNEFFSIAAKLGIIRGVTVKDSEKMDYDSLYALICRTMKVNLTINEYVSEDSVETLYDRLKITEKAGKLLANSRHSVGAGRVSVNEVNIEGTVYRTKLDVANELIGADVVYYLIDDEVVSLSPKMKLKYLTLTPYDIESIKDAGSELILKCKGDTEKVSIKKSALAIVNNKTMAPTKALFDNFKDGSVTLVETSNKGYDVMHMDIAKTVTVSATSQLSLSVRAKYTNELIKLEKAEKNLEIYKNGKSATFADIKENSVVSIICDAFSFDRNGDIVYDYNNIKWAKIYISDIGMNGNIDGLEDEYIYIDDMDYKAAYSFEKLVSEGKKEPVRPGDYVNAKLDYLGYIADIEIDKENGGFNYGYLIKAALDSGLSKGMQFKIMDTEGEIGIYSSSEKLFVDGVPFRNASLTYDVGAEEEVDFSKRQVISFRLANDGSIRSIDTEIRSSEEDEFSLEESLAFNPYYYPDNPQKKYAIRTSVVNKKIAIGTDCVIFMDQAGLGDENPDDSYFSILPIRSIDSSASYYMALYDADEMGLSKCAAIWEGYDPSGPTEGGSVEKTSLEYTVNSYLVEKIRTAYDTDGNQLYELSLTNYAGKANYKTVTTDILNFYSIDNDVVNSWKLTGSGGNRETTETLNVYKQDSDELDLILKRGDIVRMTLDSDGKINYLERILVFDSVKDTTVPITGSSGTHMLFANLYKTSSQLFMYEVPDVAGTYEIFNTMNRAGVVVYDLNTKEATVVKDLAMVPSSSTGDNVKVWLRDYHGGRTQEYFVYLY